MSGKHTPPPWYINSHDEENEYLIEFSEIKAVEHGLSVEVYGSDDEIRKTDAELIVTAVNYHERLVKALTASHLALMNETRVGVRSAEKREATLLLAELDALKAEP